MKAFWQILGAALAGAATTMATAAASDPHTITDSKKIGPLAAAGAIIGIGALLKQSPVTPTKDPAAPDAK